MNKHHVYLLLAGVVVGYFAASTLATYTPWSLAWSKGASVGT